LTPLQHSHRARPSFSQATHELSGATLAVVVLVNSLTLRHYQPTDPEYSFGTSFRYRLIRESLIFATFSAVGMGVSLYVGRLICEYIRYIYINLYSPHNMVAQVNKTGTSMQHYYVLSNSGTVTIRSVNNLDTDLVVSYTRSVYAGKVHVTLTFDLFNSKCNHFILAHNCTKVVNLVSFHKRFNDVSTLRT